MLKQKTPVQKQKTPAQKGVVEKTLSDKSGFSYIMWCVLIIAFCMILSAVLSFVLNVTMIAAQIEIAKNTLDKQLSANSVEIFQKLKEQDDETTKAFTNEYLNDLVQFTGMIPVGTNRYESQSSEGDTQFYLSNLSITYEEDFTPKLVANYTVTVKIKFAGIASVWVDVPVRIVSRYNPKYDMD